MTGLLLFCTILACGRGDDGDLDAFRALHAPVYRAYEVALVGGGPDRDALHAHLAASFTGGALTREYVEHWSALDQMVADAVRVEIAAVDYEDVRLIDLPDGAGDLAVEASWTVTGLVHHKSHTHARVNRYEAVYALVRTPGGLRIADTRLKNLQRLPGALPPELEFDGL